MKKIFYFILSYLILYLNKYCFYLIIFYPITFSDLLLLINLQKVNIKKYLKFIHHDRRQTEIITFDQNKILCKDYSCIFNIYVLYYK